MLAVRDEVAEPAFQFVSYADFVPRAIAAVGIRVTPIKYERRKVTDFVMKKKKITKSHCYVPSYYFTF